MSDNMGNLWGSDYPKKEAISTLPEDIDAEKAFIGAVLAPGSETLLDQSRAYMEPAYFHAPQHKLLYEAACACVDTGTEVNAITICDALGSRQNHVGGFTGVVDLISNAVDYEDPKPLGKIIRSKWEARTALLTLDRAKRAIEASGEVGSSLDGLPELLGALRPPEDKIVSHADLLDKACAGDALVPHELASNRPVFGVGFIDFNLNATPRRFGVIAAKTSAGKSSIAYQVCVQSAAKGRRVLLVSLESDPEEVASALAANLSGYSRSDIMRRGTNGFQSDAMSAVKANVHGYYASSGSTWETLERAIRNEHRRVPFDVVIVDYFTLLQPPDYKGRNLASLYGDISKAGKRLAQELECAVIFLSQFNRGIEDGQEPHLENLRETGQLEQDADWVLLLWSKPDDEADGSRQVFCKGAKNRGGKRGFKGKMKFFPASSSFEEDFSETEPIIKKRMR